MPGAASACIVLCLPVASPARRKTTDSARRMWSAFLWGTALGDWGMNGKWWWSGRRRRGSEDHSGREGRPRNDRDRAEDVPEGAPSLFAFIFPCTGPESCPRAGLGAATLYVIRMYSLTLRARRLLISSIVRQRQANTGVR